MLHAPARSVAVAVDQLRAGLYIRALDRPWIETPFCFQGFRITGDEEIATLRDYCRHVYVDLGRSDADAVGAVLAGSLVETAAGEPETDPGDTGAKLGIVAQPALFRGGPVIDRRTFAPRVREAAKWRRLVLRTVEDALRCAASDRALDLAGTGRVVHRLANVIREDPTASLWLTRLRDRNDYTVLHAVNTCVMSLAFGHYMGLEGRALEDLGLGALLMDVGRLTIPRQVLPKPRPLTETEWAVVRRHVDDGVRLLGRSGLSEDALDVVRMHHERVRGQGYPQGLLGESIPWTALIAGMIDTYDAMLRKRPHRGPYLPDAAIRELYRDAASTFGSDLVESFIHYLGSYPVGTVVELDNNAIGVVVGNSPGAGLWPTVLLVRNADGQPMRKRLLVNLAAAYRATDAERGPARHIRRSLSPAEARVPVARLVAREFGLEQAGEVRVAG